jgi:signal transduction histidine kinase
LPNRALRGLLTDQRGDGNRAQLDESVAPLRGADGSVSHFGPPARSSTLPVQYQESLRRLSENLELQARWIAQTLHDEAGQLLTSAHIALADAIRDLEPPARERLEEVKKHLDGIEEQLRRFAHELRPRILDDLGLVPALEFLAAGVEKRQGISIAVDAALQRRLPAVVETTLYRLVQETLTNVSRHARATRVAIRLTAGSDTLDCRIEDNGIGFDAPAVLAQLGDFGVGLRGNRLRLEALGGTFQINSVPGVGTQVVIAVPLNT